VSDLISVLIPVHNAAATLPDCLHSVLRQSYAHFEIIVIDDGSDDDSGAVLGRLAAQEPRLKVYRQPHAGIVTALNHGLQHCRGTFIARLDADDRMLPERLARQWRFASEHPQIDLLGCRFRLFRDDAPLSAAQLRYQQWSNSLLDDSAIKHDIWLESVIAPPTFFARHSLFIQLNGYREVAWAEDYDFLLRAYARGARFAKSPEILVEKRDSAGRLYRTDPRCKRPAMLAAKAHFFAHAHWLNGDKELYLAGSGSSARQLATALQTENIRIAGFIDNIHSPVARSVMGIPAWWRQSQHVLTLLHNPDRNFFLLCLGDVQGRAEQEEQLKTAGLSSGQHFLRFL
jgi:glycosyltransferase involved in cell wall biosynthesis